MAGSRQQQGPTTTAATALAWAAIRSKKKGLDYYNDLKSIKDYLRIVHRHKIKEINRRQQGSNEGTPKMSHYWDQSISAQV